MTNQECCHRGFTSEIRCGSCSGSSEDLNHVFRFCKNAEQVWLQFFSHGQLQYLKHLSLRDYVAWNLGKNFVLQSQISWKDLFATIVWWLWMWRNQRVFRNDIPSMTAKFGTI